MHSRVLADRAYHTALHNAAAEAIVIVKFLSHLTIIVFLKSLLLELMQKEQFHLLTPLKILMLLVVLPITESLAGFFLNFSL